MWNTSRRSFPTKGTVENERGNRKTIQKFAEESGEMIEGLKREVAKEKKKTAKLEKLVLAEPPEHGKRARAWGGLHKRPPLLFHRQDVGEI